MRWWPHRRLEQTSSGILLAHSWQDATAIREDNLRWQNARQSSRAPLRKVASIPLVLLERWAREAGVNPMSRAMDEVVNKKLSDPAWRDLRTTFNGHLNVR